MKKFECFKCKGNELKLFTKQKVNNKENIILSLYKSFFKKEIFECRSCNTKYILDENSIFIPYIEPKEEDIPGYKLIKEAGFELKSINRKPYFSQLKKLILFTLILISFTYSSISFLNYKKNPIKVNNGIKLEFQPVSLVGKKNSSKKLYGYIINKGIRTGYCNNLQMNLIENGKVVKTKSPYCFYYTIPPGKKQAVSFYILKDEVDLERKFYFKYSSFLAIEDDDVNLNITSSKLVIENSYSGVIMNIKNDGRSPLDFVKANVVFFNSKNKICAMSNKFSNKKILEPQESTVIKIEINMDYCTPDHYEIMVSGSKIKKQEEEK